MKEKQKTLIIKCVSVSIVCILMVFFLRVMNFTTNDIFSKNYFFEKMKLGKEAFYLSEFAKDKPHFEEVVNSLAGMDVDGKMMTIIWDRKTMADYGMSRAMARKYGLNRIAVEYSEEDNNFAVYFSTSVEGYEYAKIYYSENGEPRDSIYLGVYDDERQMYVDETYSYDSYTRKLCDNWFFFKQHWKR